MASQFGRRVEEHPEPEESAAPFVQSGPDLFAAPSSTTQTTMGDDFATNRSIEMPVGRGTASAEPLANVESLAAQEGRRRQLAAGQSEMPDYAAPENLSQGTPGGDVGGGVIAVAPGRIVVRPDLFQFRDDAGGGAGVATGAIDNLVANWQWGRYDPIAVVASPDVPGRYVVVGGHHRLAAIQRLQDENPQQWRDRINVRVLEGDISTEAGRQEVQQSALLSNYGVRPTTLLADTEAVRRLWADGLTRPQIASEMKKTSGQVDSLTAFAHLTLKDRRLVQAVPDFYGPAVELGKRVGQRQMTPDEASALLNYWRNEYDETGRAISRQAAANLLQLQGQASEQSDQSSFLLGDTAAYNAVRKAAEENTELAAEIKKLRRQLVQCQTLGEATGQDVSAMARRTTARLAQLEGVLAERNRLLVKGGMGGTLELPAVPKQWPGNGAENPPPESEPKAKPPASARRETKRKAAQETDQATAIARAVRQAGAEKVSSPDAAATQLSMMEAMGRIEAQIERLGKGPGNLSTSARREKLGQLKERRGRLQIELGKALPTQSEATEGWRQQRSKGNARNRKPREPKPRPGAYDSTVPTLTI